MPREREIRAVDWQRARVYSYFNQAVALASTAPMLLDRCMQGLRDAAHLDHGGLDGRPQQGALATVLALAPYAPRVRASRGKFRELPHIGPILR